MKSAIFCKFGPDNSDLNRVFGARQKARIQAHSELLPVVITEANFEEFAPQLHDVEVIFATWGLWRFTPAQMEALPNLKAVFYGAGAVKHFAEPLLERGVVLTSAWAANAIPVAEYTLGQILIANKGFFRNVSEYRATEDFEGCFRGRGNYGATVSILGAGQVGRKLIELLRPFRLRVLVFDPFLSQKAAEVLGVEKVETLEVAFERGDVVSNHLADNPQTVRLLRGSHFALMSAHSTFINTGRGTTVEHDELLPFLQARADVTAILDVTDPEPLPLEHPLRTLPNVYISGHMAGSIGDEIERMGEFAVTEFSRWRSGEPVHYGISLQMLETMC